MKRQQSIANTIVSALLFISAPFVVASIGLAGIIHGIEVGLSLHTSPIWIGRLIAAPILYLVWLMLVLSVCAIELRAWRRFFGYRKPTRVAERDNRIQFYLILMCYMRQRIVWQLPLVPAFLAVDGLRHLVLWTGAPRVSLGTRSFLFGWLYDPDLTDIADGVIIGAESYVVAHAITTNPDGGRLYVSAPVTIGARTVIGGQARVDLGVRIGEDAIIEPMSYVAPFTVVGAGEVWGGNPARFLRKRFDAIAPVAVGADRNRDVVTDDAIRGIVATALDWPPEQVTDDLAATTCAAWDSLAQLAMGVALQEQLGVVVPAADRFRLRSVADIREWVDRARGPVTAEHARSSTLTPALPANPELLPLLDSALVTSALAERALDRPVSRDANFRAVSIAVASTFTAEPLAASLKLWSRAFGISTSIEFAGYNQVPQTLLSPESVFGRNVTGVNLVLTRPEDLLAGPAETREQGVADLLNAIAQFAERRPGTLVVGTLPVAVSAFGQFDRHAVDRCRTLWHSRLAEIAGIEQLDFAGVIERLGIDAARSSDMEVVTRAPYSSATFRDLGIAMARLVRGRIKSPAKVLALDADGVLWGGVIAEDGIDGVHLGPDHPGRAFLLFQQHVLALKKRGTLLALVSRNAEDDVWQMFDQHPEMQLQRSDFAAARINWQSKSDNLRELADELNLGLDAFVFVDDDPANRLEVEANAPGVVVVPMPADAAEYAPVLSRLWCFDAASVTDEDLARTTMIRQEQLRRQDHTSAVDMQAYLNSLELVVEMGVADAADLPRVAQLTEKTNQFNLSLKRRTLAEIRALAEITRVYTIRARDRFGDYGLVGVCILEPTAAADQFQFDTLLMSCRALGRGVEEALLYGVRMAIEPAGATRLRAPFVAGPRNQPARDFLIRNGFHEAADGVFEHRAIGALALPAHVAWAAPRPNVQAGGRSRTN